MSSPLGAHRFGSDSYEFLDRYLVNGRILLVPNYLPNTSSNSPAAVFPEDDSVEASYRSGGAIASVPSLPNPNPRAKRPADLGSRQSILTSISDMFSHPQRKRKTGGCATGCSDR